MADPDPREASEELQALESWAESVRQRQPRHLAERLSDELREAVSHERYEEAARLRDRLEGLGGPGP